jgi:transposase
MSRYDLTDFGSRVIEPLPSNQPRGVPRVDDRRVLNGIFWVLRSGAPWRNLAERLFSKLTHFRRVATRCDKLAANFLAMVQLASMRLWLRAYESTP